MKKIKIENYFFTLINLSFFLYQQKKSSIYSLNNKNTFNFHFIYKISIIKFTVKIHFSSIIILFRN